MANREYEHIIKQFEHLVKNEAKLLIPLLAD